MGTCASVLRRVRTQLAFLVPPYAACWALAEAGADPGLVLLGWSAYVGGLFGYWTRRS